MYAAGVFFHTAAALTGIFSACAAARAFFSRFCFTPGCGCAILTVAMGNIARESAPPGTGRRTERDKGMDHIDRRIIDILQANARAPLKEIAEQVFLSSPAVSARIARLEQAELLRGYQAQVDAPALGYGVKAFINLELDPQRKPEFYPYIESCPNVVECNCVTGDYSMLIEVLFASTQELDHFINRLQQFGRTRTQIVFSTCVEHRGVPVSRPEEE